MLAPDKIKHLLVGTIVLGWAIVLVVAAMWMGISLPAAVIAAAGLTSAVTGEAHQWLDNRDAAAKGATPTRTVSLLDAAAGSAPCLAGAVALELGLKAGLSSFVELIKWVG